MNLTNILFTGIFSILLFQSHLIANEGIVIDTSEPSVGPPPFSFFEDQSAVTLNPIHLYRGAVIERAEDLSLETPISTWTNKRTYDSGLSIGPMGHEHSAPLGQRWRGDARNMTLQRRGNNIELVMTGSNRELFTSSENGFVSPPNFNATLELVGKETADEKYVLTRNATGEIFIFYGFSKPVPSSVRGKLHERTNNYYYAQGLTGETYSYDPRGYIELIITASPQAYAIRYTYNTTGIAVNRLHKIEVFDSLNADNSSKKLSEVVFTYWEEVNDAHNDVGEFGDLVQVKVSKLLSDQVSYQTRTTQYRYHRTDIDDPKTDIDDGISHQLKLVLEPSAIERLLAENSGITSPEDILKKSDTENLSNNNSVYGSSSRSFSYYRTNLDTDANVVTSWGTENFSAQYGGFNMAEIYPMRDETAIPRIKTERINAGCFTCGGEGGVQKTYFYLALNAATRSQDSPNAVTNLIIEDSQDSSNAPYQRTIYALNSRGVELRRITIENHVAQTLSTYATSKILTDKRKILEERTEDSHLLIQSNALVKQFLNPYDPSNSSWANDTATLEPQRGVIDVFEYDVKNNQTALKRKSGASGTAYYVSATDFDDKRHPVAEHHYPSKTSNRDVAERSTTRFEYSFWDAKQKVIKTRKTIRPAIPETQNGTGETAITDEYMDERGHTRWERNAQGVVTYYGVHPTSGRRTLTIRDVDTANPPPQIKKTDKKSAAWQGAVPFGRNPKRAKQLSAEPEETIVTQAANQIIETEYDKQGDSTVTTDSNGNITYTVQSVNQTIRFPAWDNQLLRSVLPISVTTTNDSGKILETYELPPTAVAVENGKPVGIQEGVAKNTWTRYTYEERTGNVKYVDRYHTIPASGTGTLGSHFYRTVTIYDLRGREVAVAQYISDGRWMVDTKKLDWRGREIVTLRGEAMNPPTFADLNHQNFLYTLTKTVYDGNRIDRSLSYFGTGTDDYIGTKYHYDRFDRLRTTSSYYVKGGTETTFGPYNIRDFDWNGNSIAEAIFDKEPNWNDVADNENYVAATKQGRYQFAKNYYNNTGHSYRRESFGSDTAKAIKKTNYYYDDSDRQIAVLEENGLRTETVYDSVGRRIKTQTLDGKNLVSGTSYDYDESGRTIGQHHFAYPAGNNVGRKNKNDSVCQTVYFWYDNAGRVVTQANYGCGADVLSNAPIPIRPKIAPQKSTKEYLVSHIIYDSVTGKQIGTTDQRGMTSRIVHDALGRSCSTISNYIKDDTANDQNIEKKYIYDGLSRIIIQIDPLGHFTKMEYDHLGRVLASLDASGNKTTRTFDLQGNILSVTDPLGRTTSYEYNNQRRQIKIIQPASASGVARSVQQVEYDLLGRIVKTIDPLGNVSKTIYNELGQIIKRIDANGGETQYHYDHLGQLLSLTDPIGNTTSYKYDSQGHVVKETNPLNKSRYFEYIGQLLIRKTDRNSRVTEYIYDRFGRQKEERWLEGKKVIKTIINTYNEIGDLTSVNDGLNSFEYEFNARKFETKSHIKFNGLNKEIVLKSEFDKRGQRILSESEEFSTQYAYTPNRLVELIIQGDKSVQYSYNAAGQKISSKTPAATSTYNYDGMGRLTKIDHQNIAHYDYQWDAACRIVSMNDGKYDYDKTNQLIAADYTKLPSEKYSYDLNGNRSNYQTGKNNQLLHDGENAYEYDSEGNRISKGSTKYFWDHRNRLAKVETPNETVEYIYDYKNRLVKRSTSKGSEYLIHDGWQIVLTLDGNGTVTNKFLWGAKQDELIAQNSAYALCDHLGTVRDLIGNGIAAHFEYSAFGQLLAKTGNTDSLFKYTGKMSDSATELQWNINRWYDAKIGRWISEDPIGFLSGSNGNLIFIDNSPLMYRDTLGLWKQASTNSTIYISEGGEDTLYSLAQQISGDWRDWVCIWPVVNLSLPASDWDDYPYAKPCARANVKNLLTSTDKKLGILATQLNDAYLQSLAIVLNKSIQYEIREGGINIATRIANFSGQGANPISRLFIAGHSNGTSIGNATNFFTPSDLFVVASEKDNTTNSFNSAKNQIGPPKCWFTKSAHVAGLGCTTTEYARNFAQNILRSGITSWGVIPYIYGSYSGNNAILYGLIPGDQFYNPALPHTDPKAFGHFTTLGNFVDKPTIWKSYSGQQ